MTYDNKESNEMYALYPIKSEIGAILKLTEAYRWMDQETPNILRFKEDGSLLQTVEGRLQTNGYVTLERWANTKMLKFKIYEDAECQIASEEGQRIHDYFLKVTSD